jgi:hypothetical protein
MLHHEYEAIVFWFSPNMYVIRLRPEADDIIKEYKLTPFMVRQLGFHFGGYPFIDERSWPALEKRGLCRVTSHEDDWVREWEVTPLMDELCEQMFIQVHPKERLRKVQQLDR